MRIVPVARGGTLAHGQSVVHHSKPHSGSTMHAIAFIQDLAVIMLAAGIVTVLFHL